MRDDEGDDHVAGDAGDGHGEQPDHGQDRAQAEVVLVVQLENDEVQYVFSARTRGSKLSRKPTWTQNVKTLKLHHSRKVMPSIAASFPFARHQIDTGMSGGGVHHLWLSSPPCSWTRSRWRSQRTKATRSRTPTMRSAMMSIHAFAREHTACQSRRRRQRRR